MGSEPVVQSPTVATALGNSLIPTLMDFPTAMQAIIGGQFITKLEWNDRKVYCTLRNGFLMLRRDGKWFQWIVNEGDLLGKDWLSIS